ncbi:TonB-dependent receptor [Roseivirga sp.]|uniref:TonB-dependent receptor n=1 Tax=Roseivirga sp. TaxID=1964215 RepID=UPI002B26A8DE|nr:TonB-dependent receptor [Roseivirga sp.]
MKNQVIRTAIIFLFLAFASNAQAQFWVVKGTVLDSADRVPMVAATISIVNKADATLKAKISDLNGEFRITGIADGNYAFKISFVGYFDFKKDITVAGGTLDLGTIFMSEDIKQLDEVTVEGLVDRVEQNGDTTIMNAAAYKVNPDATAQDLLEKMPGIMIVDGQVQAQGESVKKVLVDGREFFGNDASAALQNLPAEIIEKIQVYDEGSDQSQFTGFVDGETSKVLNIITKASMSNGEFGKVYAGAGTDETYNAGGSINLFRPKSRTTILAQTNNINIQNFATSDLLGITSGGGRGGAGGGRGGAGGGRGGAGGGRGGAGGGGFSNGGNTSDFLVGAQGGISKTTAFGINYSYQPNNKLDFSGSYFYNESSNNSNQSIYREYTLPQNEGQTYEENTISPSTNINHRFSAKIDYTINDKNSLTIRPQLTLQDNVGSSFLNGTTMLNDDILNTTDTENSSDLTAYNFSNNILYRRSFEKRGRTFSINVNTALNKSTGESLLLSENVFYDEQGNPESQDFRQSASLNQPGVTLRANATYTEPLTEKSQLLMTYQYGYQYNDSNKETYDFSESSGQYSDLNIPLSNIFKNDYITHGATVGYNLRGDKANLSVSGNYQNATLDNNQTFPTDDNVQRTFNNFLPSFNYRYSVGRTENVNVSYRTSTQAPSVSQLQNVIDNSNPLFISAGNPNLDQNYQHNATVRYTKTNVEKSTTFFATLNTTYSDNYIGNNTIIASRENTTVGDITLEPGAQYSQPMNLGGYYSVRSFVSFGLPMASVKSNLNLTLSGNYSRTPEMINEEMNHSSSPSLGLGAVFSSNISEKIDFTLSSNSSYSTTSNTVQSQTNTENFTQSTRLRLNWIFGPSFVFRSEVNHTANPGLSDGFNQSYLVWNMEFGKKLIKDKAELKLTVFDLLKQNQRVSRSINGSYIQDTNSQILTQYVMLTFTFNIRSFGSGTVPSLNENPRQRFGGNEGEAGGARGGRGGNGGIGIGEMY